MTTTNQTTKNAVDQQLTFDDQVIEKIAGITVSRVPGIVSLDGNMFSEFADKVTSGTSVTKGIKVDAGEKQAAVKMDATIEYGKSAPEIFKAACQEVATALEQMTGLKLVKFELHINDVKTREELTNDNKKEKEVA
ncbi:Asp23/Gls24 family envelope stress response protein [Limosilactobacillus sp.]|uniref:Asp23/Gls24 family envelope stress response protein n=1 Tax=Limosilactobacillus sp. TaxID=2773925 RepID=UPI00345E4F5E